MAMMCPLGGCKATHGLCNHEKMMIGIAALVVVALVAATLFGVI